MRKVSPRSLTAAAHTEKLHVVADYFEFRPLLVRNGELKFGMDIDDPSEIARRCGVSFSPLAFVFSIVTLLMR